MNIRAKVAAMDFAVDIALSFSENLSLIIMMNKSPYMSFSNEPRMSIETNSRGPVWKSSSFRCQLLAGRFLTYELQSLTVR